MDVDYQAPIEQRDAKDAVGRTQQGKKVSYYYDHDVGSHHYGLGHPMKPHRMRMTHSLVTNYGLLDKMDVFRPTRATTDQLTRFHSDEYIDFLQKVTPETVEELTGSGSRFLTGEDCPAFEGLFEFCAISAGGSINAAERLNAGSADVAINWAGGLHHAKKREASGFCYVNDIVLSILELLRYHPRVLYIDIDVHHGDGVEEAFYSTDRVMTASFHKYGDFFPGTGDVRDVGIQRGKNYAVNVPLRDGITDETYASIFQPVIQHIMDWYRPGAIVLQCGADSLAGDKLGVFNLSMKGHADCVKFVSKFDVPMIVVGGGGYTTKNVSRTWTYETGVILGQELDENLPYNDYLEYFGPRFKLEVLENNQDNQNSREYLENIKSRVIDSLRNMPFAPSVGMHEVPRNTVGKEIGILGEGADESDEEELDVIINQRLRQINTANSQAQDVDSDDSRMDTDDDESHRRTGPTSHFRSRKPLSSRPPQFTTSLSLNPSRPLQPTLHAHSHIPRPGVGPRAHSFGEGLEALVAAKAAPRKFNGPFPKVIRKPKRSFFAGASGLGLVGGFGTGAGEGGGRGAGGVVGGIYQGDGTDTEGGSDVGEGWGAWKANAVEKGIGAGGEGW